MVLDSMSFPEALSGIWPAIASVCSLVAKKASFQMWPTAGIPRKSSRLTAKTLCCQPPCVKQRASAFVCSQSETRLWKWGIEESKIPKERLGTFGHFFRLKQCRTARGA